MDLGHFKKGYDVSFNVDSCGVMHNERLRESINDISRLMIECADYQFQSDFTVANTINSGTMDIVDHFSPIMFYLNASSTSYYPGQMLQFNLTVTDRFGNSVEDATVPASTIEIIQTNDSFDVSLGIDESGDCSSCRWGVLLPDVTIYGHAGRNYFLQLSMNSDKFFLGTHQIMLHVTGCPVGYGVDSENMTCEMCDAFMYNTYDGSVRGCLPCDNDKNPGDEALQKVFMFCLFKKLCILQILLIFAFVL